MEQTNIKSMELDQIKAIVLSKVKTQGDIAKEIGISYHYLSQFMSGRKSKVSPLHMRALEEWAKKQEYEEPFHCWMDLEGDRCKVECYVCKKTNEKSKSGNTEKHQ
jgi:transcriptional regulator with XRE-family HTH domain